MKTELLKLRLMLSPIQILALLFPPLTLIPPNNTAFTGTVTVNGVPTQPPVLLVGVTV